MSRNSCCVPGCAVTREHGVPLHRFPNPETNPERYNAWISNIGSEVATLDNSTISNRRVCHKHFLDVHIYTKNRLSRLAVPVRHMPVAMSTTDVQASPIDEVVPKIIATESEQVIETTQTEPVLPSVCNVLETQSYILVLGHHKVAQDEPQLNETQDVPQLVETQDEPQLDRAQHEPQSHEALDEPQSDITGDHVDKYSLHKKDKTTNSKDPHSTIAYHKEYKAVLKKLRKCEKEKSLWKAKYIMAKKMTKRTAFNIVTKNMSHTAKLFCQMQISQSGKKKRGRRFTLEEKILALSLYKQSTDSYRLLRKLCVLPCRRTLENLLQKINSEAGNANT